MDPLKLENQLCFPLYAASREIIKQYAPHLDEIGLTYTQYLVMLVLWEKKQLVAKQIGELLFLDSGTITPVLKKLEQMNLITRNRGLEDERTLNVSLTPLGAELRERTVNIPAKISHCLNLDSEETLLLYKLLYKILSDKH